MQGMADLGWMQQQRIKRPQKIKSIETMSDKNGETGKLVIGEKLNKRKSLQMTLASKNDRVNNCGGSPCDVMYKHAKALLASFTHGQPCPLALQINEELIE